MRAVKQGFTNVRTIEAKRVELLNTVKQNREKHIQEYKEAVEGYKLEVKRLLGEGMAFLAKQLDRCDAGEFFSPENPSLSLSKPYSHEKDYDQVIKMLEFEVNDTIKVSSEEFACYVMDDWDWKSSFEVTKNLYSNISSRR